MRTASAFWYVAFLSALFALRPIQLAAAETVNDDKRKKMFEARLAELKGADRGTTSTLKAECLEKSFDGWSFFLLRHRVYPVQVMPQAPLKTNNVFAVSADKVILITHEKELEQFFKNNLGVIKGDAAIRQTTTTWLRIAQEFHQDGFFKFKSPTVRVSGSSGTGTVGVIEQKGDKGKLTVTLVFKDNQLQKAKHGGKLSPGIRPRCQAMRLLDKDPVIRAIMRRDILVMGSDCKWYLDEIRAHASPQLQNAIDDVWKQILDEDR